MAAASDPYRLTRLFFQRAMAFIYLTVFWGTAHQFKLLIGERGLQPAGYFLAKADPGRFPGLFWIDCSDAFMSVAAWAGVVISTAALLGLTERFGMSFSVAAWALLWLLHLSFVNAGQTFYSFGWEIMTLEAGFLAIFLGSRDTRTPAAVIWLLRWLVFRLMLGAGLIKLRGDTCWRDLTCMDYHYETQPMPNPLSWFFHHLPDWYHRTETAFTHFVEIVVPWGLLSPWRRPRTAAALLTIGFQCALILSGNLSWLNYLTITVTLACLDDHSYKWLARALSIRLILEELRRPEASTGDRTVSRTTPSPPPMTIFRRVVITGLCCLIAALSIGPVLNLISPRQAMNRSFDPLHLVNTYGAFGSVTKSRGEIVLEGTSDTKIGPVTLWKEYEFKGKPGDLFKTPPVVAPYHLRLDWLMWFAAMGGWRQHPWILMLTGRLLQNEPEAVRHLAVNPFPNAPPKFIRARLYRYRFTSPDERRTTRAWWVRELEREYLPPLSLDNIEFKNVLERIGWKD